MYRVSLLQELNVKKEIWSLTDLLCPAPIANQWLDNCFSEDGSKPYLGGGEDEAVVHCLVAQDLHNTHTWLLLCLLKAQKQKHTKTKTQ